MDGIKDFFEEFAPVNFWDTDNICEKEFGKGSPYREEDWLFYRWLRAGNPGADPVRLALYAGATGKYWNECEDGTNGGDGLYVLAPTPGLMTAANLSDDYNDASYVILYRSNAGRILIAGDSHDMTWEHILTHHADEVANVELLIAPHHGRNSGRSYDFLDVVRPAVTFFGNANSEHLAYDAWNRRDLFHITNNQADCLVVDTNGTQMQVYSTNRAYAQTLNPFGAFYSEQYRAYYVGSVASAKKAA